MTGGRGLRDAVLACLAGAVAVLLGAGRTWVEVPVPAGPLSPARTVGVPGGDLVGGVQALGTAGLAGVVALAATRGTGRRAVGLVLLLTGAGVVAAVAGADLEGLALRADPVAETVGSPGTPSVTAWPWVTALGGVLLGLAGLAALLRGQRWPALGARYDRTPPPDPLATEAGVWAALDRGEDPTRLVSGAGRGTDEEDRQ